MSYWWAWLIIRPNDSMVFSKQLIFGSTKGRCVNSDIWKIKSPWNGSRYIIRLGVHVTFVIKYGCVVLLALILVVLGSFVTRDRAVWFLIFGPQSMFWG
ncbi:hypothetical protein HanIR_Chr15g0770541 [Helianthus annuus]|nr:hypothetical protein HanIR_Chr15g0770541 [Helianthus annuus]